MATRDDQESSESPAQDEPAISLPVARGDGMGPGASLDGRYRLVERLGRSGVGQVFLAYDGRLRRQVALKQLHPRAAADPSQRTRFLREAELLASLRHPHVVAVHDTGGLQAEPYLVMPFHQGTELDRWAQLQEGPPLAVDLVMALSDQACDGLAAMHQAGVIHGDIKPANILVSDPMKVMLVDLGLSRPLGTLQAVHNPAGTAGFVAPELIRRDDLDPALASKTDVYSLGVTIYWLLTGQSPWGRGTPMDVLVRQVEGSITPPCVIRPELPEALDEPILQALASDPKERPTIDQLREQLRHAGQRSERGRARLIVIIDDDPNILMLEEEIIGACVEGAEVVRVLDPRAALSIIGDRTPDLVITDLNMPGLNGIELTALLRGDCATASVPIIVVTGVGGADDWKLLDSMGAECLVVKPIQPQMLADAIQRVFEPDPR